MRYYGKDGLQCQQPIEPKCKGLERCRDAARAVLFGRVPRGVVLWLGVGLVATALTMGLWGLSSLSDGNYSFVRDQGSAILIHRN